MNNTEFLIFSIYKDKGIEVREHCRLMTTSGTGPGSGVGILFKSSNSSDLQLVDSNSKLMVIFFYTNIRTCI